MGIRIGDLQFVDDTELDNRLAGTQENLAWSAIGFSFSSIGRSRIALTLRGVLRRAIPRGPLVLRVDPVDLA